MTQRMTAAQLIAEQAKAGKPREGRIKGVQKVTVDGIDFHGKGEAQHWMRLRLQEKLGRITDLRRQVTIPLGLESWPILTEKGNRRSIVVDFAYINAEGVQVYEDFKGWETPESELKRDVLRAQGIDIRLVKAPAKDSRRRGLTDKQIRDMIVGEGEL